MTTIRTLCCDDLLRSTPVHLDHLTATDTLTFYMEYLARFRDYSKVAIAPGNRVMGFILGEVESDGAMANLRMVIAAVAVCPEYRKQKVATKLMQVFVEHDARYKKYFLNLFVSNINTPAIKTFEKLGYTNCRLVRDLYSQQRDAFEMRKYVVKTALDEDNVYEKYVLGHVNCLYIKKPKYVWGGEGRPERPAFLRCGFEDDFDMQRDGVKVIFH